MSAGAEKVAAEAAAGGEAAVPAQVGAAERAGGAASVVAQPVADVPRANRRELAVTVVVALLGGIIAWSAAGRPWATAMVGEAPTTLEVAATGNDLSAGVTALGLTALAGGLALFATQRLARRLVGVLLIAAGVGTAVYAFGERGTSHASHVLADKAAAKGFAAGAVSVHTASWWIVAALGGVLVVLAGACALVRGATWPGMSSRYESAAAKAAKPAADTGSSKDLWDALDRGEDPTEAPDAAPGADH